MSLPKKDFNCVDEFNLYEKEKRKIAESARDPEEYEVMIFELCKRLKI